MTFTPRRTFSFGFLYWLGIVVVLEPGNVMRALEHGASLPVGQEILRLVGAGLLGAMATPAVFALTRLVPVEGPRRWRNAALHLAADAGLAAVLIVTSCVLAYWVLAEEHRPLLTAIRDQLAVDELLLFGCLAALTAVAHLFRPLPPVLETPSYLDRVIVKQRGVDTLLALGQVEWIESQGNYLALHAGKDTHLIRETLGQFERKLDPAHFVRIHRRTLVAIDRARAIAPLPGGDATLRLHDGTELRISRNHRDVVRARFEARSV